MRVYLLVILLIVVVSCDSNRIFEDNVDFDEKAWISDNPQAFEFEINDRNIDYRLYFNLRNTLSYKNKNIYFKYNLLDESGTEVDSDLINLQLFDEGGRPYGSGLGDIYDHQIPFLQGYKFPSPGKYQMIFTHYMRDDTLQNVVSVGFRIETSQIDVGE